MPNESDAPLASPPTSSARIVRLALVVDTLEQPLWVVQVLGDAVARGVVQIVGVGVIADAAIPGPARASRSELAYLRLDTRRYGVPDAPTQPADLQALLAGVPRANAAPSWPADSTQQLRAFRADVVWYLGSEAPVEPWPVLAAWGTIALDPLGGSHGMRALLRGDPTTETVVRRLTDADSAGAVLGRARTSTQRISVTVNHAEHLRHVAELVAGMLRRASATGAAGLAEPDSLRERSPAPITGPALGAGEVVTLATRVATRLVRAAAQERRSTLQWGLAYHVAAAADSSADGPTAPSLDPRAFTAILPPSDRYWADPFPVEHAERRYVFFEEHLAGSRDAHLSVGELDTAHGLVERRTVLKRDYHLSFPSVFRWLDAWYMTPETMTERAVQLYRADRFPDEWSYVGDLVTGARFVDPVITCLRGDWWMFVGVLPPGASEATALHLYRAPSPLGPWTPHLLNPVAIDVRWARPAGRIYERGGAFYRPVQDGAPHYGHAMTIHRIDALTPTRFYETPVARITPDWRPGLEGVHTLNSAGGVTLIDALQRVPRPHGRSARAADSKR